MFRRKRKPEKREEVVRNLFSPIERVARDRALKLADDIQGLVAELDDVVGELKTELRNGDDHARPPQG